MEDRNVFTALVLGMFSSGCNSVQNQIKDINVIYIFADDPGYSDIGCYGQTKIETPNSIAWRMQISTQYSSAPDGILNVFPVRGG